MSDNPTNVPEPLTEAHLDSVDWDNLKPGDITQVPAQGDLPAGRIEVIDPVEYARLEKRVQRLEAAGPAMVVAARTGSAVGLTARGAGTVLGWTATGSGAVARLGWRYVRAHDVADRNDGAADESGYRKVTSMRVKRWKFLGITGGIAAALNAAGWSALVWAAGWAPVDALYVVPGSEVAGVVAAVTVYGRYRRQHRVRNGQAIAPQHAAALEALTDGDLDEPQHVRFTQDMDPDLFRHMLYMALTEEVGVTVGALKVAQERWGFRAHVTLDKCTPSAVVSKLDLLEACMPGVRTSSIMPQQSTQSRNEMVLRIPGSDPWGALPELPYRAPKSVPSGELHAAQIGADMSMRPLALPMVRTSVNVVGKSRSGKSTLLRSILDALTATSDRIVIGIDLGSAGSGFGEYRQAMHAVATTPVQARTVLEWALDIGTKRPGLFRRNGMGQNWQTSPEHPAITIVVDEFPALVKKSAVKGRAEHVGEGVQMVPWGLTDQLEELFVTSAKSDVTLVIAGQGVTKEKIGPNTWVVEMPVQVMCACDKDDVTQILHTGAMGEGWLPNRLLPAMPPAVNDASVCYVMAGAGYNEPITYRASTVPVEEELRRANERAKAGLVKLDDGSARLSSIRLEDIMADCAEPDWDAEEEEARSIIADAIVVMDAAGVDRMKTEALAEALAGSWPDAYDGLDAEGLKAAMKVAGAPAPMPLGVQDEDGKYRRGYKRSSLAALPR